MSGQDLPLFMFGPYPHQLSIKPCLTITSFCNLLLLFIAMTYTLGHVWAGPPPHPIEHVRARITFPDQASLGMYLTYYLSTKMLHYIVTTHASKLIVEFLIFLRRPECNLKPIFRIESQFFDTNFTWISANKVEDITKPPSIWVSNIKFHQAEQHCSLKFFSKSTHPS